MSCDNQTPILSVLMGAYQIEGLPMLDDAITSVLSQSMVDFEFIICDDGSRDNTWTLLQDWARRDARIRLIRNEANLGLAATLNRCLAQARGTYIARQDADDLSHKTRFEQQITYLQQHPDYQFVGSNVILWDETGAWGERCFPQEPTARDFLFTMPFVHGALMFRRESMMQVGGYRVARETRRAEDYDMLMRMYAQGMRGHNIPAHLYEFCEDMAAQKRRKYTYRVDEAIVRWKGFSALGLMPQGIPYVIKPLIVGLLPVPILRILKKLRSF